MIKYYKEKIYLILRWSEKFFKTDMVYLAKGGTWLSLGQITSSVAAFLLSIAFANLLPKETYGTYKYVLSLVSLLAIPTLPGMTSAIIRAVAKGHEGAFLPAIKTKIKWGLFSALASLTLALYYYLQGNNILAICFLIVAIFLPFMDALGMYNAYLSGKKMFGLNTWYNVSSQVASILLMIATIWFFKNIFLIIFTYFAANTFFNILILRATLKKHKPNNLDDKLTIAYGKNLSLITILGTISGSLDKILLFHYLGAGALATYAFAQAPINQSRSFFKTILTLAFPKIAASDNETIKKTLPPKMIKFFIFMAVCVIAYILLAPFLFGLLFPKYFEAIKYSQLFSLILLFFPQKLIGTALEAKAQTKALYFISISSSTLRILLYFILLPIYGIYGAIYANIIPYAWNTIIQIYFFKKL